MILFNQQTHTYARVDRDGADPVIVPSVTQILCPGGPGPFINQPALDFGTRVHLEIHKFILGRTIPETPQANQALLFLRAMNARVVNSEAIVYNPELVYAGMVDVEVMIRKPHRPGRRFADFERWIIDWKVNSVPAHAGPQLAAYRQALNASRPARDQVTRRAVVCLKEHSFSMLDFDAVPGTDDWSVFRAALARYYTDVQPNFAIWQAAQYV